MCDETSHTGGATYSAAVNQLEFGSAVARDACDGAAKSELTDICTVRKPALICCMRRLLSHTQAPSNFNSYNAAPCRKLHYAFYPSVRTYRPTSVR